MNKKAEKETKLIFSYVAIVGISLNEETIKGTKKESKIIEQGRVSFSSK